MTNKRPIRIANCSGSISDPGYHMKRQADGKDIDAITGDSVAEATFASNARAMKAGNHKGFASNSMEAFRLSIDTIARKKIKVVVNGGAMNPGGMAEQVQQLAKDHGHDLKVAYVSGDNLTSQAEQILSKGPPPHLDSINKNIKLAKDTENFVGDPRKPILSMNAYLGARAIVKGLREGADIIICGRVADASPVIGLAWWWHDWSDTDYDNLAGALLAGHLIECSAYITGANFSGFNHYPMEKLIDIAHGIAEIASDGSTVITKDEKQNGFVNVDTVTSQFLYELQGEVYLNSDVKANFANISIQQEGSDRVKVSGAKGFPPPPTTKLAVFYHAGYQTELIFGASGLEIERKAEHLKRFWRARLSEYGLLDKIDILEFQTYGVPNPQGKDQFAATCMIRVFAQAVEKEVVQAVIGIRAEYIMQAFHGMHYSNLTPCNEPYMAYYPALIEQDKLDETLTFVENNRTFEVGHPPKYEALQPRKSYNPTSASTSKFGPTKRVPLADLVLARSGDKGGNQNIGLHVRGHDEYEWFRNYMTSEKFRECLGEDYKDWHHIERIEFPNIRAIHFVVYGILGRGVSSSTIFDRLGKAFADYVRCREVDIPEKFLGRYPSVPFTKQ